MIKLYKKILLIITLIILIIFLAYVVYIQTKKSKLVYISKDYVDASFTSKDYNAMLNIHNTIEGFENSNKQYPIYDKINKVYFINLDHRKDRFKQINDQFKKVGIPDEKIERIKAVNEKYNGHIGCCKSHIKTMKEILKNKHKHTIVFEDDFVFNVSGQEFNDKLGDFLKEQKNDWDIVQLASVYVKTKDSEKDYKKVERASTSSAYLINLDFVKTLLNELESSLKLMEEDMKKYIKKNNGIKKKKFTTPYALDQNWYPLQAKSRWYLFKPYLGRQGGEAGGSSILNKDLEGFVSLTRYRVKSHKLYI